MQQLMVKFPRTAVPRDTLYMCLDLALPTDREYQLVAAQTVLGKPQAVHHVLLWKCNEDGKACTTCCSESATRTVRRAPHAALEVQQGR